MKVRPKVSMLTEKEVRLIHDASLEILERCIKTAPRRFVLASRDGKNDAVIDGEKMHHMTDGQASFTIDETTGERRTSTLHDLALSTLLADALRPIKVLWS